MDLFFIDPKYFFKTYFDISIWLFLGLFAVIYIAFLVFDISIKSKITYKKIILKAIFSLYLSVVISITLFGENRQNLQGAILNPIYEFNDAFLNGDIHAKRGILSNILFFMPYGLLFPSCFRLKKAFVSFVSGSILSVVIEILQYEFSKGFFETSDIICNSIGVIIGYIIYLIIKFIYKKLKLEMFKNV